jgi:hypothetical protein
LERLGGRPGIVTARVFLKKIHMEDTSPRRELENCVSIITTNSIGRRATEFVMEPPQAMVVKVGYVRWVPVVALLNKWTALGSLHTGEVNLVKHTQVVAK